MADNVCGLDEAGRGALAGPLVAAAVITTSQTEKKLLSLKLPLRDGKLLKPGQRTEIYAALVSAGITFRTAVTGSAIINRRGIGWANRAIFRRLIRAVPADLYIIDGIVHPGPVGQRTECIICRKDADATVLPVILAGIVAKHVRDTIMDRLDRRFPGYLWSANRGYGTAAHIASIRQKGQCPQHRTVFVRTALSKPIAEPASML